MGCHPVPYVQIEIYEERGSAYARGATGLGEGGRKQTGNYIYTARNGEDSEWDAPSLIVCCIPGLAYGWI